MNGIVDAFKALTLKFSSTYIGRFFRSMLTGKGIVSIAALTLLVTASARLSGVPIAGELLEALVAAVMAGFSLAIMRQETTSEVVALPSFTPSNILKFATDGAIATALKTAMSLGLAIVGGSLGGAAGAIAGFVYGNLAMCHYAASEETLPAADSQGAKLGRGFKAMFAVADLRTVVGSAFAKPINTILALAASLGVGMGAMMIASSAPAFAVLAGILALITNAHVWSQVYRLANKS